MKHDETMIAALPAYQNQFRGARENGGIRFTLKDYPEGFYITQEEVDIWCKQVLGWTKKLFKRYGALQLNY